MADNPWAEATPADSGIVAYFWYPSPGILSVSDPNIPNSGDTKVLWVFRDPQPAALSVEAHPLDSNLPVVAVRLFNGDKGIPSSVALPSPGCWQLELTAGPVHATMDVMVAPFIAAPSPSTEAFRVNGDEAVAISTVERFIQAINDGNLDAAIALVSADAAGSDCDYIRRKVTLFTGRPSVVLWIAGLIADHERFDIGHVSNANDVFTPVVGVEFANRSSDTLARLGFPGGVVPSLAAKVVLTPDMAQVRAFALGPGGADASTIADVCGPG